MKTKIVVFVTSQIRQYQKDFAISYLQVNVPVIMGTNAEELPAVTLELNLIKISTKNKMDKVFFKYLLLICLVISGCNFSSKNKRLHPDNSFFPAKEKTDYSVDISHRSNSVLPTFFHYDSLEASSTIGNNTSVLYQKYYDRIPKRIGLDDQGFIYLIQRHTNSIIVYNENGDFKYEIGRPGRGPGEFEWVVSFSFSADYKKLYVLDRFEFEVFKRNDNSFTHYETVAHDLRLRSETDMCILGNNLFVSGNKLTKESQQSFEKGKVSKGQAWVTKPILRYDLNTLKFINSFGFQYKSYSEWGLYDAVLSQTMLSCNNKTQTIVGVSKHFPFIIGYDIDGNEKWISKIRGYKSTEFEEFNTAEGPAFYQYTNKEIFHYKLPLQKIYKDEFALLQFIVRSPDEFYSSSKDPLIEQGELRSILINTSNGELHHSDSYEFIAMYKDSIIITAKQDLEDFEVEFLINKYDK